MLVQQLGHHGKPMVFWHMASWKVLSRAPTCFEIYYSYNLKSCPFILMVLFATLTHIQNPTPSKQHPIPFSKSATHFYCTWTGGFAATTPPPDSTWLSIHDRAFAMLCTGAVHKDLTTFWLTTPSLATQPILQGLINNLWFTRYPYRTGFQG